MVYLNPRYNGRVGVYRTNEIERFGAPNATLKLSTTGMADLGGLTNSTILTTYWESRTKSDSPFYTPVVSPQDTSYGMSATNSINLINYGSDPDFNLIGSRWLMTGGTGQFSVETPAVHSNGLSAIFGFDYKSVSKTYIKLNYPSEGLVSWVVNGTIAKTASTSSGFRYKIIWDSNTKVSYVYSGGYTWNFKSYNTLVGTHSIDTTMDPFFLIETAVDVSGGSIWYGYGTQSMSPSGGSFSDVILSNYQVDGLTGSNIDGGPLPDSTKMMSQGYKY